MYFVTATPDGNDSRFKRLAYQMIDTTEPTLTLIQYVGDESVAIDYPHGNRKGTSITHIRTCPSVLKKVSQSEDIPSNVYKKEIASDTCEPSHQSVLKPRNCKQVSYVQAKQRQRSRLSHDALYNVHELAYDLNGFVAKITTYPDLILVCGLKEITREFDRVLHFGCSSGNPQLLSYDTTFQLGDFYLSPLLFRHVAFVGGPVIPALFLIHERKFQSVHEELMHHAGKAVPTMKKIRDTPIVVDEEAGICRAIDQVFPNLVRLRCWNHSINAIKTWLRKHGALSSEIAVYVDHFRELLHLETEEEYTSKLKEFETIWSHPYLEYYMSNMHPEVSILSLIDLWLCVK